MNSARIVSFAILAALSSAANADGPLHYPGEFRPSQGDRGQVIGELRQARERGQLSVGEADSNFRILAAPTGSTKTRAQVVAELREAQRLGLVHPGGEGDAPKPTEAQEQLITQAGLRALESSKIASAKD